MNNGSKATHLKAKSKHIGVKVQTKQCGECVIVEYSGRDDIVVQFTDGNSVRTTKSQICRGSIKNPMSKSVCGVGFLGIGDYTNKTDSVAFKKWHAMLERCYSEKSLVKRPSYKECYVSEEWKNFQNFARWFNSQIYKNGWHLDKDLLIKGNHLYSEGTCSLVPREINMLTVNGTPKSEYLRLANKWKNMITSKLYDSLTGGNFE